MRLTVCLLAEINLNGSIVANKGFIATMTSPGQAAINGPYVSAWGGIQSTGQFIGQMVSWVSPPREAPS
jgi:hypothetical protein